MKKIFILLIIPLLALTSCNKPDESNEIRDFETQSAINIRNFNFKRYCFYWAI